MSFANVRPYFRTQLLALEFKEWKDGFNVDNIPANLVNKSFHISPVTGIRRDVFDPQSLDVEAEVVIRTARKGFKNPADAIAQCEVDADAIIRRCLDISRRTSSTGIKNVYYGSHTIEPIANSNDNVAVLEITFNCLIILCV